MCPQYAWHPARLTRQSSACHFDLPAVWGAPRDSQSDRSCMPQNERTTKRHTVGAFMLPGRREEAVGIPPTASPAAVFCRCVGCHHAQRTPRVSFTPSLVSIEPGHVLAARRPRQGSRHSTNSSTSVRPGGGGVGGECTVGAAKAAGAWAQVACRTARRAWPMAWAPEGLPGGFGRGCTWGCLQVAVWALT